MLPHSRRRWALRRQILHCNGTLKKRSCHPLWQMRPKLFRIGDGKSPQQQDNDQDVPTCGLEDIEMQDNEPIQSGEPCTASDHSASAANLQSCPPDAEIPEAKEKPKRQVTLLPSVFEGRPPVILFTYTEACGAEQRNMDRAVLTDINGPRLFYSHTNSVHEYNAVINTLRHGGLYRVSPESPRWSLLWSKHPPPEVLQKLKIGQRTNHFPGSWNLGRKDLLWRNIAVMQHRFGSEYEITPRGYVLPAANAELRAACLQHPQAMWIWKPCSGSCGRGISVLSSTSDEMRDLGRKRGIVQQYVKNPLLIDGYKFDLRIYVVVLSFDPLKIYINDEGLVRFATERYSLSLDTLQSRTMHLTNYSVNKLSEKFVQNTDGREGCSEQQASCEENMSENAQPSKWSLKQLREHFAKHGLNYRALFENIADVVIKTMLAVEGPLRNEWSKSLDEREKGWAAAGPNGGTHRASCSETLGFDVLVDSDLKPWLLEVNICPSLSSGSPLDKRIKTKLVADMMTLVGLSPHPGMWRQSTSESAGTEEQEVRLPDGVDAVCTDIAQRAEPMLSVASLEKRAKKLAACHSALDAIALFERTAWQMVLDAHDEEMRCGGLERIYPTANSAKYKQYFSEESYYNIALRKWYEAGGAAVFQDPDRGRIVPSWIPRQITFSRT